MAGKINILTEQSKTEAHTPVTSVWVGCDSLVPTSANRVHSIDKPQIKTP
jgi:hypothetical protein